MSPPYTLRSRKKPTKPRAPIFTDPFVLENYTGSITLNPNETVQLLDRSLLTIEHFEYQMKEKIPTDPSFHILDLAVYAVGRRYFRFRDCDDLAGFLVSDSMEVYKSDYRERIPVTEIVRKVTLVKTNLLYPALQSRHHFTCRYIRRGNSTMSLSPERADPGNRTMVSDTIKRNIFLYGENTSPPPESRYRFGDAFCGVGGTSAGARKAGMKISWAFDADYRTAQVYRRNFPRTDVLVSPADQFIILNDLRHVDVMHISPPCQTWSMAHTVAGKNDDANSASLFIVKDLLLRCRPRVVTMEQVCGLARKQDNKPFFRAMLRDILEAGYSYQWKYVKTQDYGVPQIRERIIIIAACPGQPMPSFPPQTHGSPPLLPYKCLVDAISNITFPDPLHDPRPFPYPRFSTINPYLPFPVTIIASGNTGNVYPDGTRPFTKRELARCQTFDDTHIFGNVCIERQIGNAVPPLFAQRVFESVIAKLKETDGR